MAEERHDSDKRPSPDALLEAARREEGRVGKLRIFVGAAPGVGKTYEMLQTARARKKDGYDIVVGVVETHGRKETEALLEGLEVIPRRPHRVQGPMARGDGHRCHPRPPAADRAGRRARPHQCARQPSSQALPRRAGDPEQRHRRLHHRQHPAHRKPERRRCPDHAGARSRDRSRLDLRPRRFRRADRSHARRPHRPPQGRQGLCPQAGRSGRWSTSSRRPI